MIHAKQFDQARHVGERLISQRPGFALGHFKLGGIARTVGDYAGAICHFNNVLKLTPDDAEAHYNLAITRHAQHHFDRAVGHF